MRSAILVYAALLCITLGAIALRLWQVRDRLADVDDAVWYVLAGWNDTTTYAAGFTEATFARVEPGMSSDEVTALLGTPLLTAPAYRRPGEAWFYTQGKPDRNYWLRSILFDSSGHVIRAHRTYFVD